MATIPAIMDALLRITLSLTGLPGGCLSMELKTVISVHRHTLLDIKGSSDVLVRQTQGLIDLVSNLIEQIGS